MKKRGAENNTQISQPRAHCTYSTRSLHRQLLSALLLLLVVAASCSQVGPGCFGVAERTINHINVQSDISTTGGLNGHYVYRLTRETNAANNVTSFSYDAMSNRTGVTDALNRTTNFSYDEFNRLTRITYPEASTGAGRLHEDFAYDSAGNLLQKTDQAGRVTSLCYDTANRLVTSTDPALKVTS
jgi:YD repeat-containing protein